MGIVAAQGSPYGDLTDLPTYDASGGGELTTSYVQGAHGLVEQRSGEATSYPLVDGHGDITAIAGPAGGVESRQTYDPWGVQLSGPTVEMGYLGAQERRADPASGLIQMGERSYSSSLGGFLSEDPVLGHFGVGASFDRYLYVRDNPLNRYDLNGRDVCVPTPFGGACAEDAAEDVGNVAKDAAESTWNTTAPVRNVAGEVPGKLQGAAEFAADRAKDFWKEHGSTLENIYRFAGSHWATCVAAGSAGAVAGATIGAPVGGVGSAVGAPIGGAAGCAGGVGTELILQPK